MISLSQLIENTLNRLKKLDEYFISKGYKPCILFSGGKDSLVVLDLCYQHYGNDMYVCYIHIPGNTHEECDRYVFDIVDKYGFSNRNFIYLKQTDKLKVRGKEIEPDFFVYAIEYGLPIYAKMRWCLRIFKLMPLMKLPCNFILISGEKQSDSIWRFKYIEKLKNNVVPDLILAKDQYYKHYNLKLIYDWKTDHVLEYVKKRKLKLNPLYRTINHSGNCMLCPGRLSSIDRILNDLRKNEIYYPYWYNKIIQFFKEFMKKHREMTKCNLPCSKCPYMRNRNRYIFAKKIGIVLELLNENSILKYLTK